MRAEEALRKPGDAARRESDGAKAFRIDQEWIHPSDRPLERDCVYISPGGATSERTANDISGDDWQPLVTAERVRELHRAVEGLNNMLRRTGYGQGQIDSYVDLEEENERHIAQITTLTAELEKARSGEAWVGEELDLLKRLCGEVVGVHTIGEYTMCKDVRCDKFREVAKKIMDHFYQKPAAPRCADCNKKLSREERGQRICELCSQYPSSKEDAVFRFDHEAWCLVHCVPHSDVVQVTSNIASEEVAEQMAEAIEAKGGHALAWVTAGTLMAALELVRNADKPDHIRVPRQKLWDVREHITHGLYHLEQSNLDEEGKHAIGNFRLAKQKIDELLGQATTAPLPPAEPAPEEAGEVLRIRLPDRDTAYKALMARSAELKSEPTPTPAPAKPEWLAKGVRAIVVGGEVGWAFKTPCSVVHVSDQGELLPCFVSGEVAVIPHPDNDPELAASLKQE